MRTALAVGGLMLSIGCARTVATEPASGRSDPRASEGRFTILHTNDFHGRHLPFAVAPGSATAQTGDPGREPEEFPRAGRVGGFARLATAVERIRAARGADRVLLLDGGDSFGDDLLGNLTRGEAMIRLMNEVGYQLAALGNHDFDHGVERTRELQALARFPMRGANVIDAGTGQPFLGDPHQVFVVGGIRVAVLALGYHHTPLTTSPENVKGLRFASGVDAARAWVPRLRERADVVVLLSHEGSAVDRVIAREVPGIDLIVGAHSHDRTRTAERVGEVRLVQALSDAAVLGEVTVEVRGGRIAEVREELHTLWEDRYPPAEHVRALVEALRAPHLPELTERIATAAARIDRQYRSESPFDALVGELLREHTGAEVALLPGVGYGLTIQPGPITREALYTLLPHPSRLVTLRLTGAQLLAVLEQSATNQRPDDPLQKVGGLIQTSGLRWTVDLTRPSGSRIRDVSVGEAPLDPARGYAVVTHDGMHAGLHRYDVIGSGTELEKRDERVTDVVEEALRKRGTVGPPEPGKVTLIQGP